MALYVVNALGGLTNIATVLARVSVATKIILPSIDSPRTGREFKIEHVKRVQRLTYNESVLKMKVISKAYLVALRIIIPSVER